jgi:hypothetical protein
MKNLIRRTLKLNKPSTNVSHSLQLTSSTTSTASSFTLDDNNSVAIFLPHDMFTPSSSSSTSSSSTTTTTTTQIIPLKRFSLAITGRRVIDVLHAVLDEIGLTGFSQYFVLKIIIASTGTDLLCSFAGSNRSAIVQKVGTPLPACRRRSMTTLTTSLPRSYFNV